MVAERDGVGGVRVASAMIGAIEPTHMDERLIAQIERAAAEEGASCLRMQSGAGHDAMILGRRIPAAMLFVPSLGGRSHHVSEDTDEADIRRACASTRGPRTPFFKRSAPTGAARSNAQSRG